MEGPHLDAIRRSYDAVATEYTRRIAGELDGKPLDRALLDAFAEQVRPLGRACDLGCGPGHVGGYLAGRGLDVIGIDLSPALIEEARRLFPSLRFEVGDMLALPLANGSLGGVAAFYSLIHLSPEDRPRAIDEIRRVLVPRGLLLLAFHVGSETVHLDDWWGNAVSLDFHLLDPVEARRELEAAGFTVEATMTRAPYDGVEYASQRAYILARRT
jgi:SAM-dependent methyltransferase